MSPPILVPGVGPSAPQIAFVGEAPGANEERLGLPFVGASGHFLDLMCQSAGICRRECYVTNVSKRRPPGNDFRRAFYTDFHSRTPSQRTPELERFIVELQDELRGVKPRVIVALGEEALRALTGKRGITKWRGSILDTPLGRVVPTFHPASVLRMYIQRRIVEHDLRRARSEAKTLAPLPTHDFTISPTFDQVIDFLSGITPPTKVSFDIETLGERVRCLGIATSARRAMCIPFVGCRRSGGLFPTATGTTIINLSDDLAFGSYWASEGEEHEILKECDRILGDPAIPLIAQNFPFDATLLVKEFGIVCRGLWMDTMVAQHCCYCELPKGLDFLCSMYTRVPYYSDYSASSDAETWTYNCYDCAVTYECALALEREMKELEI